MSAPPTGHTRARLDWLDYARAIGIALIVLGHANRSIGRTFDLTWPSALQALDTFLYAFHVPLFFILSGIAIGLGRSGLANFSRGLVWGLIYPYLLWSIIWIGLKANLPGGIVNAPLSLSDGLQIFWQPVEHFWFLYHLILIRLIWYFGELTLGTRYRILVMTLLAIVAVGLRIFDSKYAGIAHFLENFVFFGLGLVFVYPDRQVVTVGTKAAVVSFAVFLLALWLEDIFTSWPLRLTTGLTGTLVIIAACQALVTKIKSQSLQLLAWIGQASLAIYLLHGIVIGSVRTALRLAGQLSDVNLLVAGAVAGIFVPLAIYLGLRTLSAWLDMPLLQWAGIGLWRGQRERRSAATVGGRN